MLYRGLPQTFVETLYNLYRGLPKTSVETLRKHLLRLFANICRVNNKRSKGWQNN
jgi:hypothetical protein